MKVLCFGEILWDFLPDGLFAGGAPFNVAYHLHQHGADARIISAVGRDVLGHELIRRLGRWRIETGLISQHDDRPTGYVVATVGPRGDAHYEIVADVAWDRIGIDEAARQAAAGATALVFGSLAQRSSHNRTALQELLSALPREAWRVFDVNLRPPHDDLARVRTLARQCTLLKLNAEEAVRLTTGAPTEEPGREEAQAHQLAIEHGCRIICITAGARGAGLLHDSHWHWEPGRTVDVSDTVGAGDSFLAALLTHLTAGAPPADALARACRVGEWVASRRGATPPYDSSTPR